MSHEVLALITKLAKIIHIVPSSSVDGEFLNKKKTCPPADISVF
jgi:hypothetical protein